MPTSIVQSTTPLFDRVAKAVPPALIALSASFAAYEAAPILLAYFQSDVASIAAPAPPMVQVAPEPIAAPVPEVIPAPRVQVTAPRSRHHHVVKHHHGRKVKVRQECADRHRQASRLGSDFAPVTSIDDAGDVPPLTLADAIGSLFRGLAHGG